jgi:hypothetical protein
MKLVFSLLTIVALAGPAFAQAKKEKASATPAAKAAAAEPAKAEPKSAETKATDAAAPKAMPMNARADMIDAAAKTFTQKRKDGVEVKHVVTDKTEIKQGDAAAKFEDIKLGDQVSGLRVKKSDTEYEVVKITKFAPSGKKVEGQAEGEKKKKE